ncbi:hypothetical protein AOL_s00215g678 [Orbilia oligospora ATCC 24927]|uniref:C2H2-type domain-containing protein n=2 Tax=Orbilia oligospora TaxID=2813651 RepID=G1XUM0_ARTOA|nr:hypothetical protein AOL_s00215g678 [Orbilia oligospora ATCC 24927]EGX43222.1 hypothetical protein AOL_s00215g678 [Orbilia oligospora ATCC 24927]KAF3283894.1 hypothetical protein TWF970_001064 [Orbilia oligospora]
MSKRPHRSPSPSSPPPPSQPSKYTRSVSPSDTLVPSSSSNMTPSIPPPTTITCTLPTCPQRTHQTTESFENHYTKFHINRCHDCLKNFPTSRILECHIRENHDMFAVVKRERGEKIYACFVEDCDKVCISFGKRRAHLIDKHYYHKNFNFSIVDSGIDRAISLLTTSPPRKSRTRVRRVSEASNNPTSTSNIPTPTSITTTSSSTNDNITKPTGKNDNISEENKMDIDSESIPLENSNIIHHQQQQQQQQQQQKQSRKHTRSISEPSTATVKEEAKYDDDSSKNNTGTEEKVNGGKVDEDIDMADLASKMSAIRFVPPSVVRFGRRGGGSGFSRK